MALDVISADQANGSYGHSLPSPRTLDESPAPERLTKLLILGAVFALTFISINYVTHHSQRKGLAQEFAKFAREHHCEIPGKPVHYSFYTSWRNKLRLYANRHKDLLGNVYADKFRTLGPTYALYDSYDMTRVCHTTEPANVHAVMASAAKDYRVPDARLVAIGPIESRGVVTTEGALWLENRRAINVGFRGARETRDIELGVQELLANLDASVDAQGWTDPFLMFHTFAQMTLDRSTKHMFGVSAGLQASDGQRGEQHVAWKTTTDTVARYVGVRSLLGTRAWIWDSAEFRAACARLRGLCDEVINRALDDARKGIFSDATFVGNLVQETADGAKIRDVVLDLFVAGHNMTSGVLSWLWFELEKRPDVFQALRKEVCLSPSLKPHASCTYLTCLSRSSTSSARSPRLRNP